MKAIFNLLTGLKRLLIYYSNVLLGETKFRRSFDEILSKLRTTINDVTTILNVDALRNKMFKTFPYQMFIILVNT